MKTLDDHVAEMKKTLAEHESAIAEHAGHAQRLRTAIAALEGRSATHPLVPLQPLPVGDSWKLPVAPALPFGACTCIGAWNPLDFSPRPACPEHPFGFTVTVGSGFIRCEFGPFGYQTTVLYAGPSALSLGTGSSATPMA